jgi:hypothetical protein
VPVVVVVSFTRSFKTIAIGYLYVCVLATCQLGG